MGKAVTRGQSHNLISVLANNADWDNLDGDTVQKIINDPKGSGQQFTAFLRNGARLVVGALSVFINRNHFNPAEFIEPGWSIKGDETDSRSAALTELDPTKVQLVTQLHDGETRITGEESLSHLKASGKIRLDAYVFLTLWENKRLIPESWKDKTRAGNTKLIFFDGTVFHNQNSSRYVLYLYWHDGEWFWNVYWLEFDREANCLSAVLDDPLLEQAA